MQVKIVKTFDAEVLLYKPRLLRAALHVLQPLWAARLGLTTNDKDPVAMLGTAGTPVFSSMDGACPCLVQPAHHVALPPRPVDHCVSELHSLHVTCCHKSSCAF